MQIRVVSDVLSCYNLHGIKALEAPIRTAHEKRAASQDTANGDANELTWRRNAETG